MDTTATTTNTIESPKTNYYAPITKEMILDYLRELKPSLEKEGISEIGLFGSFAKDEATIYSDIDVFIRTTKTFREKHRGFAGFSFLENLRTKIAEHFNKEVDLCNIVSFDKEKQDRFLEGAIYV